jgi:hypothetical protein
MKREIGNGNALTWRTVRARVNSYSYSGLHGGQDSVEISPCDPVWPFGEDDGQMFDSVADGRSHGVPAGGGKIPLKQIWKLVAYINALGTPKEPDPPTEPANEIVPNPEEFMLSNPGTLIFIASPSQGTLPATGDGSSK